VVIGVERGAKILVASVTAVLFIAAGAAIVVPTIIPPDVRIGFLTRDLHQLALQVALDNGYFLEEGVRVQLVEFGTGNLEMTGFLAGLVDMGYVGAAPALKTRINNGIAIKLLAGVNLEGSAIVVNPSITTTGELAGKKIATPAQGNVQDILLALASEQAGLNYQTDFTVVYLSPPLMIQELQTAQIDGFVAWEPYIASSQAQGVGTILNTSHEIWPDHPCCVVACQASFLQARPDIVGKVMRAHLKATEFIRTHHDEAVAIASAWTGLTKAVVEQAMSRVLFNESLIIDGYRTYLTELVKYAYVPSMNATQIDALLADVIDPEFLS
jgi:NitT/TauT family transport system substrate-binding protein